MTDATGGEAAAVEDTEAAPEAAVSSQERDYEAEARDMGWVPETEWKGDRKPKQFLSAEEFVERGEHMIPILKKLREKDKADFEERLTKLDKAQQRSIERMEKVHQKEIAELTAQKRAAIKTGNVDMVEAIDQEIAELKEDGPDKPEAKSDDDIRSEWMTKNSWYTTDSKLYVDARDYSMMLAEANPKMSLKDNLAKVDAYMKDKLPGGSKQAANGHAAVDGGGDFSGALPHKETLFSKLPAEAKRQFAKDLADPKLKMKDTAAEREQWARDYNS